MSHLKLFLMLVAALLVTASAQLAAQVPPHPPGTICYTPQSWCWAPQPGAPGSVCYCPSGYGWIAGRLG